MVIASRMSNSTCVSMGISFISFDACRILVVSTDVAMIASN